jgi:malonate-semialdehyde dehydrogenase (acetylating) / methylmalonate-semialdehyde dehydrogenase
LDTLRLQAKEEKMRTTAAGQEGNPVPADPDHAVDGLPLIPHWVGGSPLHEAREFGEVSDPATGRPIARVAFATEGVVDKAVQAGVSASKDWGETSLLQRVALLQRLRTLVEEHADELIVAVGREHGKTRADAEGELRRGIEVLDLACSAPLLLKGQYSEQVAGGVDTYSLRQPLGVCAGITPFNFPAMVPLWMFPIALAAGNSFILKPSEVDPSPSMLLAELVREAGIPDGVFNVVQGDKVAVGALLDHPDIASVSFVGSTGVAQEIYARAARSGKRVQALGGAKNHMVVMPDGDFDLAADALISAAFGSTGQRCMAIATAVAVGDAGDELVERLSRRAAVLTVGPADSDGADMGPLATAAAKDRVLSYIETGDNEGATLVCDGRDLASQAGFFVGPTIFDDVKPDMAIYRDEVFGPVLTVVRVSTIGEALDLIRRNPYGNGAAIFTRSGAAARRFQHQASAGMIGINVPIPVPVSFYSFGGWKQSLFGDQHLYGEEGFRFYTRGKVVTSRWPSDDVVDGVNLSFPSQG